MNDTPTRLVRALMGSVVLCGMVAGCVTTRERETAVAPHVAHAHLADKPAELHRHFYVALSQGQRNRVLNDMRLGLAVLELGRFDLAEELFDDALLGIEAIYADNETAKKARELFTKELVKDFKGEPYERVMAYYYRGLLYLRAGDYDNARASFKGGMLQDAFAEEDQNRSDFALMAYLQGWAARCGGNPSTAADDFKEFATLFRGPGGGAPVPTGDENVLVLVETGTAPAKFSDTDPNSPKPRYLKFSRPGLNETARVTYVEAGATPTTKNAIQVEDIYRQAATRGGREFDAILAGKAQFKSTANTIGDVALVGAAAAAAVSVQAASRNNYSRNNRDRDAAAGAAAAAGVLLIAGLMAKAAAEAAEPNADTRYWDNLPSRVHGLPIVLPPSVDSVSVDFLSEAGVIIRTRQAPVWRAGKCGVAWVRGVSALPGNPRAPFSAPAEQMAQPVVIPALPAPPPAPGLVIANPNQPPPAGVPVPAGVSPNERGAFDGLKDGFKGLFTTAPVEPVEAAPVAATPVEAPSVEATPAAAAGGKPAETFSLENSLESVKEGFLNLFGPKPAKAEDDPTPKR